MSDNWADYDRLLGIRFVPDGEVENRYWYTTKSVSRALGLKTISWLSKCAEKKRFEGKWCITKSELDNLVRTYTTPRIISLKAYLSETSLQEDQND